MVDEVLLAQSPGRVLSCHGEANVNVSSLCCIVCTDPAHHMPSCFVSDTFRANIS